jgi:hypothetical protein
MPELLDQPRRQTMSFGGMPAAVEADPEHRTIRLVFLVAEAPPPRPSRRICLDQTGASVDELRRSTIQAPKYVSGIMNAARRITAAVEQSFTGLTFTAGWTRWLVRKTDRVQFDGPVYSEDRGTLEFGISIDRQTNYDLVYGRVLSVLEGQPDYEPRGSRRTAFTIADEDAIERMPKEGHGRQASVRTGRPTMGAFHAAGDVLRRCFEQRRRNAE